MRIRSSQEIRAYLDKIKHQTIFCAKWADVFHVFLKILTNSVFSTGFSAYLITMRPFPAIRLPQYTTRPYHPSILTKISYLTNIYTYINIQHATRRLQKRSPPSRWSGLCHTHHWRKRLLHSARISGNCRTASRLMLSTPVKLAASSGTHIQPFRGLPMIERFP